MEQMPPIFVISLKGSPRRDVISQRLNGLNLNFRFIDGINGKELTQDELNKVDYEFYLKRFNSRKPLTIGEVGCALSHLSIYEMIVQNKIEKAIILEDDAIVSQVFESLVKDSIRKSPDNTEIIFYDHGKAKSYCWRKTISENYRLVHYRRPSKNSKRVIICATAYLITLSGAQKLLKVAYPLRMPADYLTGALQLTKLKAYGVEPPCVFKGTISEIDAMEPR
ncbi:glycosyltransferase family 25 protein [Pasteurella dagmatis]|uniref:LPS glycosyltransferase n=1 Tax=Pasteurella dagmatis ATCC 43325 TaxID=667128 RepID=C9PMA6_9PAST|nr:glycosyltransferase family 25 protein [Pasteurella dagmatis]EEX51326.1 LPS glycosyltransferase [Pasteurella dagmatis ATCC 43325]SNV40722.1 protein LosA [Pasteurella dagmatis]